MYGLSSTYCTMTGNARSFCPAIGPSPRKCTPKPSMVAPSGRFTSSAPPCRSEEHTSELQSPCNLVCRLLLEKKKKKKKQNIHNNKRKSSKKVMSAES